MRIDRVQEEEQKLVSFERFAGVDNVSREDSLPEGFVRAAENVYFDRNGKVQRRIGRTQAQAGAAHSLFPFVGKAVWCEDTTMYWGVPGGMKEQVTVLSRRAPCRYVNVDDTLFYTNGYECGRIRADLTATPWALPAVTNAPAPVVQAGNLDQATYEVAYTFETATGEESGTYHSATFTGTGAQLTLPQPSSGEPNVVYVNVYLSEPDSDILRLHTQVPVGVTSFALSKVRLGRPLETQFLVPMPAGNDVNVANGRLIQSYLNFVLIAEPWKHGLFDPSVGYIPFQSEVQMIAPVGDGPEFSGIYVADKHRTYFLQGSNPETMTRRVVHEHGAQFNAVKTINGAALRVEYSGGVPVWLSRDGRFLAGLPGGQVITLSDNVVVDLHGYAAPFYHEVEGARLFGFCVNNLMGIQPLKARDS